MDGLLKSKNGVWESCRKSPGHAFSKKSLGQLCSLVSEHLRQAVHLLYEQNIVFYDLRDPNFLYDASKSCAVVVNFNWPGIHEVDRYPAMLNPTNNWPEDVLPYGLAQSP